MNFSYITTVLLKGAEVEIEVSGRYTPGCKGSWDEPPEAGDADIHSIVDLETQKEIDIPDDIYAELVARSFDEAMEQFEEDQYEHDSEPRDDE